ncbi:MAG TPA: hypothetical protein VK610_09540 [Rhodothermales bacterium]|nr:hypothetical protein [Rhodothermales bacterium]
MGYVVRVLPAHRLGVVRLHGVTDGADVAAAVAALAADQAWDPTYDAVWDCRGITKLDMAPTDLRSTAGLVGDLRARLGTGRRAVLVRAEVEVDLAQILSRMAGRDAVREMRPFRLPAAAAAWLGVPAEALEDG